VSAAAEIPAAATGDSAVDDRNPWLGLASFTEETRQFFYGRDEEVAELARRVQRKLLTILFGQSGLGKTSILRAGLVPRLRSQGYCPVYVRIDYGRDSPEPAEQIKLAIARTARHSGEWTQVGVAAPGESLWEFLHHRDDVLRDESGKTLIPLLIFDQFEEIFTLAQSDEFGRKRAAQFIEELSDLVENRPPKALEAKLDSDESGAERFDFARSDYRVLIALREDYLAPLEGLKKIMPSISQNRLRLARMNGEQALSAVLLPGKRLVNEEVAAAIVRFVAGGAELGHAEVEPSLLSLICRELNDARIAQGRDEISLDLLAGSHAGILSSFYERALADQPPAVRQIIEDDLLTSSGYRENVAEERLITRFREAGAAPDTLATLVNRRLLRIEERLDVRRVELTHDVLCGVVMSSRDLRRERESREATERLLAEQRAREMSARAELKRAHRIAAVCTVLAGVAIVAAVFAFYSTQRAKRAEMQAQSARAVAEDARKQAQRLLGYLTEDFVPQFESVGRLDVVAEFAKRQIAYFHDLPSSLKDTDTTRNGAMALVQYARSLRRLGKVEQGSSANAEAIQLLEGLRSTGDDSEATTIALASGYDVAGQLLDNRNDPKGPEMTGRAAALLKPLAERTEPSKVAQRAYVEVLVRIGFQQQQSTHYDEAVRSETEAMALSASLGALDFSDIDMAATYTEACAWLVGAFSSLGRNDEARTKGQECYDMAEKVLDRRPGYRSALHAAEIIMSVLVGAEAEEMNPKEALRYAERELPLGETLLRFDPDNVVSINNMGVAYQNVADVRWSLGSFHDSIDAYTKAVEEYHRAAAGGITFYINHAVNVSNMVYHQSQLGDFTAAAATAAQGKAALDKVKEVEANGGYERTVLEAIALETAAYQSLLHDDFIKARDQSRDVARLIVQVKTDGPLQEFQKYITLFTADHAAGRADYLAGDYAAAEKSERDALAAREQSGLTNAVQDKRDIAEATTWLGLAIARQGRSPEAAKTLAPALLLHRQLDVKNHGELWQHVEFAFVLYAQGLADKAGSAASLSRAAALIDALPADMRALHEVHRLRDWIAAAERGAG
jgi:tetratricopeptide (TPR) repeat protein